MTLQELTTPLTRDQITTSIYNVLQALGVETSTWKPGGVVRALITCFAYVLAAFSTWSATAVRAGFLLLSSGDWLRSAAKYDYGTDYVAATFATGTVTVNNSSGNAYSFAPGELVCQATLSVGGQSVLKFYHNTANVVIGVGPSTVTDIAVQADEIGSASTAPAGAINTLVPPYPGLTVSNPVAVVGQDDESDASLTARALLAPSAVSPNGPADAYRYVCTSTLSPTSGTQIANRVRVIPGNPVQVYVLGASGAVSGSTGDPSTDLGAIYLQLTTRVLPIGIGLTLQSGSTTVLTFGYTLSMYQSALSDADINTLVAQAVAGVVANVPIGGHPPAGLFYLEDLRAAIVAAVPGAFHVTLTISSDIALSVGQALTVGTITQTAVNRY